MADITGITFSSLGGTSTLLSSNSNWSDLYFTAMLKGTVSVSYSQRSRGPGAQVSPPRPGMSSISPRSSSLEQAASSASDKQNKSVFIVFILGYFILRRANDIYLGFNAMPEVVADCGICNTLRLSSAVST